MLKQLALNCDVRLGTYLNLHHIAYTGEALLKSGHGSYTREEWTQARRAGYNQTGPEGQDLDTEQSFLRRAFDTERRKLLSGLRLADYLRKSDCKSFLELGCGEMITAWAIKGSLPKLRYCATDYDDFVIEKCRKLALLGTLDKSILDIDSVSTDYLGEFQFIAAWDVFYAFDSDRLIRFLQKIKKTRSSLIICSSQIIGPLRGVSYLLKSYLYNYAADCTRGILRDHGFKCTVGYYRQLAARLGLECQLISMPPWYSTGGDCYFFIKISQAPTKTSMPQSAT